MLRAGSIAKILRKRTWEQRKRDFLSWVSNVTTQRRIAPEKSRTLESLHATWDVQKQVLQKLYFSARRASLQRAVV